MIDKEKVIKGLKGLECCVDPLKAHCFECQYYPCYDQDTTSEKLIAAALELLKAQETTLEKDGHHIRCLNCGEYWCDNDKEGNPFPINFCPNCGKRVKWE